MIRAVTAAIPDFKKAVPDDVDVRLEFDQSPHVTTSMRSLIVEGLLGAALTGLMVLIFLRDWRGAPIVVLNIPFTLLSAAIPRTCPGTMNGWLTQCSMASSPRW